MSLRDVCGGRVSGLVGPFPNTLRTFWSRLCKRASPESGKESSEPKVGAGGPSSVVRCIKTEICESTAIRVADPGNLISNRMT